MAADFEVRNHSVDEETLQPAVMVTIQVLSENDWANEDLDKAQAALTSAYAAAFAALTERVEG